LEQETEFKFYPLKRDRMFKTMMRKDVFQKWFKEAIYHVVGIDIGEFELLATELTEGEESKQYVMDTLLKDIENNYVIIEMQNTPADRKNLRYLYRVAGNVANKGEKDEDIDSNVILIQLDGYTPNSFKYVDKRVLHFTINEETLDIEKQGLEMYEILLQKFDSLCYNEYEKRFAMINCKDYKEFKKLATSEESKKIVKEVEMLCMDENLRFAMEKDEYDALVRASEKDEYLAEGIDQGKTQERNKILKNMLDQNKSDSEIISTLDIAQEELDEIKSTLNKNN